MAGNPQTATGDAGLWRRGRVSRHPGVNQAGVTDSSTQTVVQAT
jgi:hypothetical protein